MLSPLKLDTVAKRLLVPSVSLLVALMAGLLGVMVARTTDAAQVQAQARGEATADLVATVAQGPVAQRSAPALDALAEQLAKRDAAVRYVAFFDETGRRLTQRADAPGEPLSEDALLRFERPFQDASGRKSGWMTLLYDARGTLQGADALARAGTLGVLGMLVLFTVGLVLITRRILRPIRELTRLTQEVVRTGDLRLSIQVDSRDEVGQLATAFQEMMDKMRAALASLQTSSHMLDASVSALSSASEEQSQTITRQAAALQEAQVTTQEIRQTSLMAAQKAEVVLQAIGRADAVSQAGEQAVEESRQGLAEIQTQVLLMARRIEQLGERTKQIAAITDTVKGLADQSNMLALNAAIEAVRSGEAGKGFGVVAREIRSLADQSIDATGRVRTLLEDITGAIGEVVRITQEGAMKIASGLEQVNSSGDSLRELSVIVKENSAAARQIAAAVDQQNAGIAQISTAVQELSAMMEDTVRRLESTGSASTAIKAVSEEAAAVVRGYRV